MYIYINVQAVTVTACLTGAALLTFINCSTTNEPVVCRCGIESAPQQTRIADVAVDAAFASTPSPLPDDASPQPATTLVVTRATRTVAVVEGNQVVVRFPVAVGKPGWETPAGRHRVGAMKVNPSWKHPITGDIIPPGSQNPMGTHWIQFWENEHGHKIGLHGTNNETSIGRAVSHGCVRMKNSDITILYGYVEIGTTVIVQ